MRRVLGPLVEGTFRRVRRPGAEGPGLPAPVPGEGEPEPDVEPPPAAVLSGAGGRWNVWDLERASRASSGDNALRDEERKLLLLYLRDFAGPDGLLPGDFDRLVRDSFGELIGAR